MTRSSVIALATLIACGCRSSPRPSDEKKANATAQTVTTQDAGATVRASATTDAGLAEGAVSIAEYRTIMMRELMRLTKSREANVPATEVIRVDDAAIPHSIEVLKKIGQSESYIVTTAGYGRLPHGPRKKAHVELLAYVDQYAGKIGQVLEALGESMHTKAETAADWKEYDTVQLPAPLYGMQFFDLRGAGEIDVSPDLRVTLLKVVPMSHEEFEAAQKNPAGEWDDPNANARSIQRWRRVLEH